MKTCLWFDVHHEICFEEYSIDTKEDIVEITKLFAAVG